MLALGKNLESQVLLFRKKYDFCEKLVMKKNDCLYNYSLEK